MGILQANKSLAVQEISRATLPERSLDRNLSWTGHFDLIVGAFHFEFVASFDFSGALDICRPHAPSCFLISSFLEDRRQQHREATGIVG